MSEHVESIHIRHPTPLSFYSPTYSPWLISAFLWLVIYVFSLAISMSYTLVPLGTLSSLLKVSRSLFILGSVLIFCVCLYESTCSRWISLRLETQWPNEECQGKSETAKGFVLGWKTTGMINMWCESAADAVTMIISNTFTQNISQVLLHEYNILQHNFLTHMLLYIQI